MKVSSESAPPRSVAILGAGALGRSLAGVLTRLGYPVELVLREASDAGAFRLSGRVVGEFQVPTVGWSEFSARLRGLAREDRPEIWVTVRAWQLDSLWEKLPASLQAQVWMGCNGLGLSEGREFAGRFLAWFGSKRVSGAVPTFEISEGGGIEWAPSRDRSESSALAAVADFFSGETRSRWEQPEVVEWRKAIWNSALNPLAALARSENGQVVRDPLWRSRFETAVREGLAVARASLGEGQYATVFGSEADFLARLVQATEGTAQNRNSLRVDLEAGRSTELPWLLDRVREEARRREVAVPELDQMARELADFRV